MHGFKYLDATQAALELSGSNMTLAQYHTSVRVQRLEFYVSLRKKTLEGFLRRRGINYKRSITKSAIISRLDEDDERNPSAAEADGFKEAEPEDNDDIDMAHAD
jgi:hypothetical protein